MFRDSIRSTVARINRIVKEEFSGCSAIFDKDVRPMVRPRIQDAQGTILSRTHPRYTIAELEELSDYRPSVSNTELCGLAK